MLFYLYTSFVIINFCKIELLLVLLLFINIIFFLWKLIYFFHVLWCSGLFRNILDFIDGRPKSLGRFWLHTKKQNNSLLVVFLADFTSFPEI